MSKAQEKRFAEKCMENERFSEEFRREAFRDWLRLSREERESRQVAALERAIVDLNVEKHLYVQLNGIIETEWLNSTNLELCVYIGKLCQVKGFAQNES